MKDLLNIADKVFASYQLSCHRRQHENQKSPAFTFSSWMAQQVLLLFAATVNTNNFTFFRL